MIGRVIVLLGLCTVGSLTQAASPPKTEEKPPASITESAEPPAFKPKPTAMYYTATQYAPANGDVDAWNLARLGYQFTENFHLSYNQIFLNDYRTTKETGFNFRFDDAYVRLKWGNVHQFEEPSLKLGFEQRYYLPTSSASRDKTLLTGLRNRFLTSLKITEVFSMGLEESPTLFWYRDPASSAGPNEIFRNYAVLTPTLSWSKAKVNVYFPLYVQNSLFRDSFGGVTNKGPWKHTVFLWPEVTYGVGENLELGLTAVTGALVSDDLSGLTISEGLKDITTALEMTVTL